MSKNREPYERRTAQQILDDADDFSEYLASRPLHRQPPPPPTNRYQSNEPDFYGVPRLALAIIVLNFGLWGLGLLIYWTGRVPVLYVLAGLALMIVAFLLWLGIAYIHWRFFWWLMALYASMATVGLGYLLMLLITGAATLSSMPYRLF